MRQHKLLALLKTQVEKNIQTVEDKFAPLSDDALNQKPEPDRWSILECLEHLNYYDQFYLSEVREKLEKPTPRKSSSQDYRAGWLGGYSARSMKPQHGQIKNRMSTFTKMDPAKQSSSLDRSVMEEFLENQRNWMDIVEKAEGADLNKNHVPTTLARWIRFKLGDMLRFVLNHAERHILQAERVWEEIQDQAR